jgi:dihydrofolate reductase
MSPLIARWIPTPESIDTSAGGGAPASIACCSVTTQTSDAPFHTPVFVLTHHPRPSIEMEGGTTFHFLDVSPAEALETAREAADGQDLRIGGGATVIRDFLAAGLVDHMHIVVVPILLGRGTRLWEGLEGVEKDYQVEAASSPSGVTHVTFTRAA